MRAYIGSILLLLFLAGCSGSKAPLTAVKPHQSKQLEREYQKDIALRYFIEGSIAEGKGNYEGAIREYFRALLYDDDPALHAAMARNYIHLDMLEHALPHARQAVGRDSSNTAYHALLADLYLRRSRPDSAAQEYEKILQLAPENIEAYFALARLYQYLRPARAIELYRKLLDRLGTDWDVMYNLAETYSAIGQYEQAADALSALVRIDPDNETLLQTLGDLYIRTNNHGKAIESYSRLVERYPDSTEYGLMLAELHEQRGSWSSADSLLTMLLRRNSGDAEISLRAGEIYLRHAMKDSSSFDRAAEMLTEVSANHPREWRSHWHLGALEFHLGDVARSVPHLLNVLKYDPDNLQAMDLLARSYLMTGEFESAIKPLQTLVDHRVASAETYAFLGFALSRLGKDKLAIDALQKALEKDPLRMDALSTLALTFDGMKRHSESDKLYERALLAYEGNALPKDATYYLLLNNFAYALSERGEQLDRALEMSRNAVAFDETNSSYLDTMGWIHYQIGQFEEARRYIAMAVELRISSAQSVGPVLYEHLGDVYIKLGNKHEALRYWTKSLEEDPTNTTIKEKIASISP